MKDLTEEIKVKFLAELIEKTFNKKREYILILLEILTRTKESKPELEKAAFQAEKKVYKKLEECFRIKIKSITLTLTKNYDLKEIKIECE